MLLSLQRQVTIATDPLRYPHRSRRRGSRPSGMENLQHKWVFESEPYMSLVFYFYMETPQHRWVFKVSRRAFCMLDEFSYFVL